jgi:hypothetical protein
MQRMFAFDSLFCAIGDGGLIANALWHRKLERDGAARLRRSIQLGRWRSKQKRRQGWPSWLRVNRRYELPVDVSVGVNFYRNEYITDW